MQSPREECSTVARLLSLACLTSLRLDVSRETNRLNQCLDEAWLRRSDGPEPSFDDTTSNRRPPILAPNGPRRLSVCRRRRIAHHGQIEAGRLRSCNAQRLRLDLATAPMPGMFHVKPVTGGEICVLAADSGSKAACALEVPSRSEFLITDRRRA